MRYEEKLVLLRKYLDNATFEALVQTLEPIEVNNLFERDKELIINKIDMDNKF